MKSFHYAIIIATLALASCVQRPAMDENGPKYYVYDPQDTIDNELYWQMLRIDSMRTEYLMEKPMGLVTPETLENLKDGDDQMFDKAEAIWHKMMVLCSKKQYEEALNLYIDKNTEIDIALANTTHKFELDYYVVGPMLFGHYDHDKAAERMIEYLEYDKFITEKVIQLGESQSGYVPPHYAAIFYVLGRMYVEVGNEEKAEEQAEPFRKALYMLDDDEWDNEYRVADYKITIYSMLDEWDKVTEAIREHKEFIIQYGKKHYRNVEEELMELDELIKALENDDKKQKP